MKRYYKTLGTTVITSPMSPLSLRKIPISMKIVIEIQQIIACKVYKLLYRIETNMQKKQKENTFYLDFEMQYYLALMKYLIVYMLMMVQLLYMWWLLSV